MMWCPWICRWPLKAMCIYRQNLHCCSIFLAGAHIQVWWLGDQRITGHLSLPGGRVRYTLQSTIVETICQRLEFYALGPDPSQFLVAKIWRCVHVCVCTMFKIVYLLLQRQFATQGTKLIPDDAPQMASVLQRMHEVRSKSQERVKGPECWTAWACWHYVEILVEIPVHFSSLQIAAFQKVQEDLAHYLFRTKPEDLDAVCCLIELYIHCDPGLSVCTNTAGMALGIFRSCLSLHSRRSWRPRSRVLLRSCSDGNPTWNRLVHVAKCAYWTSGYTWDLVSNVLCHAPAMLGVSHLWMFLCYFCFLHWVLIIVCSFW